MTALKTENLAKPAQALLAGLSLGTYVILPQKGLLLPTATANSKKQRLGLTSLRSLEPEVRAACLCEVSPLFFWYSTNNLFLPKNRIHF